VRSQTGQVVTSEGIHWLCLMLLVSVPWCRRQWALPVISVPTPLSSDQRQTGQTASHDDTGCTASDLACEMLVSSARDRVGGRRRFCRDQPGSYLSSLASSMHLPITVDRTTLRSCPAATQGQARSQAQERSPPAEVNRSRVKDKVTVWLRQEIAWYAGQQLKMDLLTGVALWHRDGEDPLPIRWVLLRDPSGKRSPFALFCTDPTVPMLQIVSWYVSRWNIEVTFLRSPRPSRSGNAAAVEHACDCTDHSLPAGIV
jgi:hypothetical protein